MTSLAFDPRSTYSPTSRLRRRVDAALTYLFAIVFGLAVWQVLAVTFDLGFFISEPIEVWAVLVDWFSTGSIWIHIGSSVYATVVGFVIGAVVGVATAFALYASSTAEELLSPYFSAAFALPKAALAPILLIWLGIGSGPKIALGAIVGAFLFYHYMLEGLKAVPESIVDSVRVMGAGNWGVRWWVLLPASRSSFVYAAQIALPKVFTAVIVGEVIGSNRGLGQLARFHAARFQARYVFAAILIMVFISVVLYFLLSKLSGSGSGGDEVPIVGE
jgi:NitT/TauT family transport system permease protein